MIDEFNILLAQVSKLDDDQIIKWVVIKSTHW